MNKIINKTIFYFLIATSIFGWGRNGHIIITNQAFALLKNDMKFTQTYQDSTVAKANDPDRRIKYNKDQAPWHYIDIDFYKEFNEGRMIELYDSLLTIYSDSTIKTNGTLPWVVEKSFNNLVKAFESKDTKLIYLYSADLAHFVEDSYMPLHTTTNYDGQLTNQKGIHSRYESKMVDMFLEDIKNGFYIQKINVIENPLKKSFNTVEGSFSLIPVILTTDLIAGNITGYKYEQNYLNLLWKKTEHITLVQMNGAAKDVASYIYSAWLKAGQPKIENLIE
ncbi:MAG: S1/P1 nuclease [bacterium]